jgi:hypothetical protein
MHFSHAKDEKEEEEEEEEERWLYIYSIVLRSISI